MATSLAEIKHNKKENYLKDKLTAISHKSTQSFERISYGATKYALSDKHLYPHFFRMVQNDHTYYKILSRLLKQFNWNWIGILTTYDDAGETEQLAFMEYLSNDGICVSFTFKLSVYKLTIKESEVQSMLSTIEKSSAQIIVLCGSFDIAIVSVISMIQSSTKKTTIIIPPSWSIIHNSKPNKYTTLLNGSLALEDYYIPFPEYGDFFDNINPSNRPNENILSYVWTTEYLFRYEDPSNCSNIYSDIIAKDYLTQGASPRVYYTVFAMASALHEMHVDLNDNYIGYNYRYQLNHYIKNLKNMFEMNRTMLFDDAGEFPYHYTFTNWVSVPCESVERKVVGNFSEWVPEGQQLFIDPKRITWLNNNNEIPRSQCSDNCLPGFRKMPGTGIVVCCYDCTKCPDGEISNKSDSENCIKCPDNEWSNEKKNKCIPKVEQFLSFKDDAITIVFAFVSVLLFLITLMILVIFHLFKETAIIKANNKNLSFVLLVSVMLSFLCVFLFLGRPVDITCKMRQSTFFIIYSIAVSSVLGKTVMICIIFKASRPGSNWKNWVNMKVSNSLVLFFSLIQIIINITWLIVSPPFHELDMQSYPGIIIVQCNEGSVILFYSVLGYMGFLAAVSFILAFLARTLPDSFNEAKYITFSMLVFCSVWIAMIPAYLSTKGKNMVIVEIFAILTSSAGLLGCIFLPKCFIIVFKPEINTKTVMLHGTQR
ncbi:vomeronasal type-2 receptor 26-like [Pelobates fuscus]|uniref:vomeronasal type-2 receptor 26-like n=1 Tax=Pelobates fuscus TaxID=191477 RepID=UPI002FE4ECF9